MAQNELLSGTWYVDHMVLNGIQHNNYYNEGSLFDIEFTSNPGSSAEVFTYEGHGACNTFSGDYVVDENTSALTIQSMNITLADCGPTPKSGYEAAYVNALGGNTNLPNALTYAITGTGDAAVLTITNTGTGNYVVYNKTPRDTILVTTWFLTRIEIPGNPAIHVPTNEFPTLNLTNDVHPYFFDNLADGYGGECNSFNIRYDWGLNGGDHIQVSDFSATLAFCGPNDYEGFYFGIIGDNQPTTYFDFEISEDASGATLTLTDLLGAKLIFGDVSLSVEDHIATSEKISLKQNPVASVLELNISDELHNLQYTIVTLQGKTIKNEKLLSNVISVDKLQSGIYFLTIEDKANTIKTLKFVKK